MYILIWQLTASEIIDVSNRGITIGRSILGFGLPPKEYSSEYIKALRVSPSLDSNHIFGWSRASRFYGMGRGLLGFDCGARTVSFGAGIDEAEAKQILSEIQQRYSQYRSAASFN